jgi:hypothetical protein
MKPFRLAVAAFVLFAAYAALPLRAAAQGPHVSFYYHPETDLPWARAVLHQGGGATQKIPFLPVVNSTHFLAPLGTGNLTRDVAVDAPLVFLGNGLSVEGEWDSYIGRRLDGSLGEIDVAGKIVLFSYDAPDDQQDRLGRSFPLERRITEAARRDAAAVVLFSSSREPPFLVVDYPAPSEIPDIPAITVTRQTAIDILAASGAFASTFLEEWASKRAPPQSRELITSMRIGFAGAFGRIETDNFTLVYPPGAYSDDDMREIARLNEHSLVFLMENLRGDVPLKWDPLVTVSFPGFDSKLFYTRHWGRGLASAMGIFNVFEGGVPDWGLVVHENAHILTGLNWGSTTSFLSEGIATHLEALATDRESNHERTVHYLVSGQLFPLDELITFDIGQEGLKTHVAYPAAGSFTGFLIETYGLQRFREAYALEARTFEERERDDTWVRAFGKELQNLEMEWLGWLSERYQLGQEPIQRHLDRVTDFRRTVRVDPATLDRYVGSYMLAADFPLTISRDGDMLFVVADQKGEVNDLVLKIGGQTITGVRESGSGR